MVSYSRRPQSGQITCYLNRTYHVLLTLLPKDYCQKARIAAQSSGSQAVLGEGCLPGALRYAQGALDFCIQVPPRDATYAHAFDPQKVVLRRSCVLLCARASNLTSGMVGLKYDPARHGWPGRSRPKTPQEEEWQVKQL
jgi:hypothetical protein